MIAWGSPKNRPENRLAVRLLGWTNLAFTRLYHHAKVRHRPVLPRTGPAILVCNHISGLDPLFIQSCCPRLINWMMAKEYFDLKSLGFVFRTTQVIPVDRSGRDLHATRAALRTLYEGRVLGIFPEGRISTTRDMLPFQTGVALMAIKADVQVYPAYIDGTQRGKEMKEAFARPNAAILNFGPPVEFDRSSTNHENLEAATAKIRNAVNSLASPARADL